MDPCQCTNLFDSNGPTEIHKSSSVSCINDKKYTQLSQLELYFITLDRFSIFLIQLKSIQTYIPYSYVCVHDGRDISPPKEYIFITIIS